MGGSKLRDGSSNLVVLCSLLNGLIESDHRWARVAQEYGWKLNSWQDPKEEPVFDTLSGTWFQLDDDFNRKLVRPQGREE